MLKVLIAYDSRRGTTRAVAERIGLVARGTTPDVTIAPVGSLRPEDAASADLIFLGAWVRGLFVVGAGPSSGAMEWTATLPSLEGKLAAVFCTYDFDPKATLTKLAEPLRARGAEVLAGHASRRRNRFAGVDDFARAVMSSVRDRTGVRSAGDRSLASP